jgi:hypothetical protein
MPMRTKGKKLQKVVNMAVVRTSDRVTDQRGTIIELTVQLSPGSTKRGGE